MCKYISVICKLCPCLHSLDACWHHKDELYLPTRQQLQQLGDRALVRHEIQKHCLVTGKSAW